MLQTAIFIFLASTASATICFDNQGNASPEMLVCNTTAEVSTCCNPSDHCMSNGLCLNGGANNLLGVQGCTDAKWPSPCEKYCPDDSHYAQNIFPCVPDTAGSVINWCCGPNATGCCNSNAGFQIPIGTPIFKEAVATLSQASSLTTATTAVGSGAVGSVMPVTSSTAADTSTSAQASNPNETSTSKTNSLAVGLGVGIPLAIIMAGILSFLAWELRRYNNIRLANNKTVPTKVESMKDLINMQPREIDGRYMPSELGAQNHVSELSQTRQE